MGIGSVFISHKHKDQQIARVVADFIEEESGNRVDVFLSSDPRFKGPRAGMHLDQELENAISDAGLVILVYTGKTANVDWMYCIYECAFAKSRGLRVLVFQCVDEAPAPFLATVRHRITEPDEVYKFTKDFLTTEDFLRGQQEKVTQYAPADPKLKKKADTFHLALSEAIEKYLGRDPEAWSAWPSLRLRLSAASIDRITAAPAAGRLAVVSDELLQHALVMDSDGADSIFGLGIDNGVPFGHLIDSWKESYPDAETDWLELLSAQIEKFEHKRFPELRDARLPEAKGQKKVLPIVTNMLSYPVSREVDFDIHFYDIRPRSRAITEVMVAKEKIYCRRLDGDGTTALDLRELYRDMKQREIPRLPILDASWHVLYMVHRSVISEFLLETDIEEPTVQHLLDAPGMTELFQKTIAFTDANATVEEARIALSAVGGARDLFVTQNGAREEPILGMMTNTDLEQLD